MVQLGHRLPLLLLGFASAAALAISCGGEDYPTTAFRCDPGSGDPRCPAAYVCCSTDPAAVDLSGLDSLAIPEYAGGNGLAVFSGENNAVSDHGRCVDVAAVGEVNTLAEIDEAVDGCPMPCDPGWDAATVQEVCGEDTFCCQTDEIEEADCVLDNNGCWRPVRGEDIEGLGGLGATDWGTSDHATHQDPRGTNCQAFVEGIDDGTLAVFGLSDSQVLAACYRRLSVASNRGLCTAAGPDAEKSEVCPLAHPDYLDACERKNEDEGLSGC